MASDVRERPGRALTLVRAAVAALRADPPDWLTALRADPATVGLGLSWLDDDAITEAAEDAPERPSDWSLHTAATQQHIRLNRPHLVPVATSSHPSRGFADMASTAYWYVDGRAPERLLFAPDPNYPTFLHVPVGTTAGDVAEVLAGFFPDPPPTRTAFTKVTRGFMGYREDHSVPSPYNGGLEAIDGLTLDRYYTMNVFSHGNSWGSAFPDDPYPAEPLDMLQLTAFGREALKQDDGVPSKTWRTAHSGSYVTVEIHKEALLVGEIRYRPGNRPEVVADLNARFGSTFPTDLPVDAVGMLLGFDFQTADIAIGDVPTVEDLGERLGALQIALAVTYGDLDGLDRLRPHLTHEDPRFRVRALNMLLDYNYEFLLEELVLAETEATIVEQTQGFLDEGIGARHPDAFEGEGDDYDDEDEDDE